MAPQQPTARGIRIRNAHDAHLLFYAVHLKQLPMIHSRLDPTERSEVRSGSVFIWEERSSSSMAGYGAAPGDIGSSNNVRGIERWTDGLKWGPSRVRDDFLFYQEKDPSDRSSALTPPPTVPGTNTYRPIVPRPNDLLIKQTYSVHYRPEVLEGHPPQDPPRKWHLTAYHSHGTIDSLADVTTIPQLDGLQVPPELFRKARVGKRKEGNSLPPLPSQNPTHAQLAGTPTPYSPPPNLFNPQATPWNPPPNFDPQAGHPIASSSDLSQRNRRGRPPSRSVEGNSPPFTSTGGPYPRGTDAIEAAKMRHATSQGALRDGRGDGGWLASNDNGYGQNGRGNYGVYPGSGGSEPFSPASSTMSGLSLPSPVSVSGGNALANGYGSNSANGGYGSDQSRQFPPVRAYGQGASTAPQNAFSQDRPTGQQYSLSPAAWNPSTPQPGSQGHTPPNESPQISQQQPNMLPRLQTVSSPMPPPSYPTQPNHYNWYNPQQTQQHRPQLPPFGQTPNSNAYPPPTTSSDGTLRTPVLGGHNPMSSVHRPPTWGGGSSYSSYQHQQYDAQHGHHQPVQSAHALEAARTRDREDERALLQLSRPTVRDDVNVKTEDLNSGMPMGGPCDGT